MKRNTARVIIVQRATHSTLRAALLAIGLFAAIGVAAALGQTHGMVAGVMAGIGFFLLLSLLNNRPQAACYANNFGVLNNTILIFDAFSQFLENLIPLRNLVLDVQDEKTGAVAAKPGDTITVKDWRSTVTAYQANTAGGGYNQPSDVNIAGKDRQITLPNTPWAISIVLTAEEFRLLSSGITKGQGYDTFRDKLARLMRDGLGKQAISDWFAVITAANFANQTVSAAGTFSRSTEIDLDTALFGRNVPAESAMAILPPSTYGEWAKDHIIIQSYTGENRQKTLLMGGAIQSQNSMFTIFRTNRPMGADFDRGFCCAQTSVIAAFRVPDEATFENDPVSLQTVIDPMTKIPFLVRLWKNPANGQIQLDMAAIWVFSKGQVEAIERIKSAA